MKISSVSNQSFGYMAPVVVEVYRTPEIIPAIVQRAQVTRRVKPYSVNAVLTGAKGLELPTNDTFIRLEAIPADSRVLLATPRSRKSRVPYPKLRVLNIKRDNQAVKNAIKSANKPIPVRRFSTDNLTQS